MKRTEVPAIFGRRMSKPESVACGSGCNDGQTGAERSGKKRRPQWTNPIKCCRIIRKDNLGNQVEKLDKPAADSEAYLAISKRLREKKLLERFNKILDGMKKDGSYRNIVGDFISDSSE